MPTENPYLDGTGSFVSTATNAGTVKFASFDDSSVNTGVIAISATFTGTAVNSGIIGDVFPTQYATLLAANSANWDSTYNTVSDLSATWGNGGGGSGGAADLSALTDVSGNWDAAYTFVSMNSSTLVDTNDSRLSDDRTPLAHTHAISDVTGLQTALDGKQSSGSYATLVDGKVPSNQLPSYVDDVIEESSTNDFPVTGETSKIYVATGTNKTYRWSGSAYVEISPSPGSTDSVTEGSTNLYFTDARAVNALQSTVNGLQSALDGKQASGSYAASSHTHAISGVTGLQSALDGKQASGSYAASSHTHAISDVTGLQTTLDGKQESGSYAASSHTHAISSVTGLQTTLNSLSSSISSSSSSSSSTTVNTITATSYTLLASDANNVIRYNSASDTTITIPANVMSVGSQIVFVQMGVGKIITSAGAGVIRVSPNSATKTVAQYAVASLIQTAQNEWLLTGDVS
jgi:hypothetical protein